MASRTELVYDEDDYVPPGYVPPKPAGGRTKPLVAVIILGIIIGAGVVLFAIRNRERGRFARIERVRAEQAAMDARRAARPLGAGEEVGSRQWSANWDKIVGSWSRVAGPDDSMHYPIRFDISDGPSRITFADKRSLEVRITVRSENKDSFVLVADPRVVMEGSSVLQYHFKFRPDDSIVLNDSMGGLVYTRE